MSSHGRDILERPRPRVLVLGRDAVGSSLVGALVETLGYDVRFARPPESGGDALRRVRPQLCLLDAADAILVGDEFLGRAAMRGVVVVVFGTEQSLERRRDAIRSHHLGTLVLPPDVPTLERTLESALRRALAD